MASPPQKISGQLDQERPDPFAGSRYRALSRLASSAVGDAYVVEHLELKKRFFAKALRPELVRDPPVVDRVRLEAQSLGRLRHPNVVAITGFERTADGAPFIVMELLKGRTLDDELRDRGALPVDEALDWTRQLLSALEAVHDIGIIHRDVHPKNLFLHALPSGQRILKVLDFGAVRIHPGASERAPLPLATPTREGVIVGTPGFASPEAGQGRAVDPRSDLYQVGLVLYTMLAGREPFERHQNHSRGEGPPVADRAPASRPCKAPSTYRSGGLAASIDSVVLRAIAADPDARFQTASEFRRELEGLAGTTPARPSSGLLDAAPRFLLFFALSAMTAIIIVTVGLLVSRWR